MGSSFFSGNRTGSIGGSSLNNAVMNDPIHKFLFGTNNVQATAGPYAGVAPTLASAQRGYALTPNGQAAGTLQPGNSAQLDATFGKGNY